jgi:hypothetical protein
MPPSTGTGFHFVTGGTLNVTGTANITTGASNTGINFNSMTVGGGRDVHQRQHHRRHDRHPAVQHHRHGGRQRRYDRERNDRREPHRRFDGLTLNSVTINGPTTGIANTTNFGTLTIGASVNVSAATALNLTTGAVSGTFANVTSTGGTNGVNLNAVTGTWARRRVRSPVRLASPST